jgi:hypothetical protein
MLLCDEESGRGRRAVLWPHKGQDAVTARQRCMAREREIESVVAQQRAR